MNKDKNEQVTYVPETTIHHLKRTRPWVLFLSILGFIFTILIILATITQFMNSGDAFTFSSLSVNLFLISIHFFIAYFLFKYARSIKKLIQQKETELLEKALSDQANFWKFTGVFFAITTIVLIIIAIAGLMELIPLFFLKAR